jgi:glucose/arabinose dehydrogenase
MSQDRCARWATLVCVAVALVAPATASAVASAPLAADPFASPVAARMMMPAAGTLPEGFTDTEVLSGLFLPTTLRWAPDGRVFVAQLNGVISVFDSMADPTPSTYADLRRQVYQFADKGLLGMALDPRFTSGRPYVYVLYTYDKDPNSPVFPRWEDDCPTPPGADALGCVASARLSRLDEDGTEHVLVEDWCGQFSSHSVGALNFGRDGTLYASAGDGASYMFADYGQVGAPRNPCGDPPVGVGGEQTPPTAQGGALRTQSFRRSAGAPVSLDGSIIRVDPDTGEAPPDNPAVHEADANRRRIVAYGARNPFRFTFRPGTSEIWFGDVGWNVAEEVNRVPDLERVRNYGWPCYEGVPRMGAYDTLNLDTCEDLYAEGSSTPPYFHYEHGDALGNCAAGTSSVTGISFYAGNQYPAHYRDALFVADYARSCILMLPKGANGLPNPGAAQVFGSGLSGPVDLQQGPDEALYYVDLIGGSIHRIAYPAGNHTPTAVATATPDRGPTPLSVSFDGSASSDPDQGELSYSWDLDGDGTFGDAVTPKASWTYTDPGNRTAQLRVTDAGGASDTVSVTIAAGDAPVLTIDSPAADYTWATGDTIHFSGSAVDGEGTPIPAEGLSWKLNLRHCSRVFPTSCHTHLGSTTRFVGSGSFTAPDHDYPSHLELVFTATDAHGLSYSKSVLLQPKTVALTLVSDPIGAQLSAGADTGTAPFTHQFIENSTTTITAATPQGLGGLSYQFESWSDGGAATHSITVPRVDTTYTASFTRMRELNLAGADVIGTNTSRAEPGHAEAYRTLASQAGTVTKLRAYLDAGSTADRLVLGIYDEAGHGPGALLGQAEIANPAPAAWNEVTLPAGVKVSSSTPYWIVLLNPSGATGTLAWRDRAGGSGGQEQSSPPLPELETLPAIWANGPIWSDGPVSAYAFGIPDGPQEPAKLAISPAALEFAAVAGVADVAPKTISLSNVGGGMLDFTVSDDAEWLSATPAAGRAPAAISIAVDATALEPGSYTATVNVTADGVDGSPKTVPVTLVVREAQVEPELAVTPDTLSFTGVAGGAAPASKTLAVANEGGGTLVWAASKDAAWLRVSPETGSAPGDVTVFVDATGLAPGSYAGAVRISAGEAAGSPRVVPVSLTVEPMPDTADALAGAAVVGTNVSGAPAGGAEAYRIAAAAKTGTAGRLRVYVDADSTATELVLGLYADFAGNPTTLLSSGRRAGLVPGAWNEVTLDSGVMVTAGTPYWIALLNPSTSGGFLRWRDRAGGVGGAEQTSADRNLSALPGTWAAEGFWSDGPVSAYALAASEPELSLTPGTLSFAATQGGGAPAAQSVQVAGGSRAFSVSDDATWLSVSPSAGNAPASLAVSVDHAGLAPGNYAARITVGSQVVDITLTVAPRPVASVAPTSSQDDPAVRPAATPDSPASPVSPAPPATSATPATPAGLVGAWGFDERSGPQTTDSSGMGHTGRIAGAARAAGRFGGALAFTADKQWVTVASSAALNPASSLTVEGWVRPAKGGSAWRTVAVKEASKGLAWGLYATGSAKREPWSAARRSLPAKRWTHLAVTYDAIAIRLYVDGAVVATRPRTAPLLTSSKPLRFGGNGLWREWYRGLLDEIRVYDRALSAAEIRADMTTAINPGAAKPARAGKAVSKSARIRGYRGKRSHGARR